MRILIPVLAMTLALAGWAPPDAVEATPATEAEPAPLYVVSCDPHQAQRMVSFRDDEDPILRGLARGEIRAGDPIEPLVAMMNLRRSCQVTRSGEFVTIHSDPTGYGGTRLIASNGKLIAATTRSCVFRDVFFDGMTEASRKAHGDGYFAEMEKQMALRNPPAPTE